MFSQVAFLVVAITSSALSMAVFGSLLRAGIPGLARWLYANTLIAFAFTVLALQGTAPGRLSIVVAGSVAAYGILLVLEGCRQFFGLCPSRLRDRVVYLAWVIGLIQWAFVSPDPNVRIVLISAFLAYVRVSIAWMAFRLRPVHRPKYSYYFLSISSCAEAAVHVVRGLAYGFGWERQTSAVLTQTPMSIAFLALGILALPCLSIGMLMLAHDRMAERMERLATVDELTGALVRRAFTVEAQLLLKRAARSESRLSIAILDIDSFKAINDEYGHAAGDAALRQFASLVSRGLRRGDVFGRLGGEEFALLFPSTRQEDALLMVDTLRMTVAASPFPVPGGEAACTFSAGVGEYCNDDSLATLMARADSALYSAKAMGRNRIVAARPSNDHLNRRLPTNEASATSQAHLPT
jgi:diguanylate cyclase (GGDEF)-like protein